MSTTISNVIGIFGGSFDPPHIGHLKISRVSIKKLKLSKLYWIVTKKNPFKNKTLFTLDERILKCKNLTKDNDKINIKYLDKKLKSSRIIKVINFFKQNKKNRKIYLIIGSDNLLNFHKWLGWKKILKICELVVFSRKGFDKKAQKSIIIRYLKNKNIIFIKNKKIDISSTQLRKILQERKG